MFSFSNRLTIRFAGAALCAALSAGCATGTNPRDPFEQVNRGIYSFNDAIDRTYLTPIAEGYRAVVPQFVRSSVSNFFANVNDVVVMLNNLLQGKFTAAYSDFGRIAINTTFGVGGLFDVASEAGIEKHDEDFGQTLGYWGVDDGPFIMLPLFGPSSGRDAVGRFVDYKTDPLTYIDPNRVQNIIWGTRIVHRRSELLDATTVLQTAALDPYEFVRDAYLQRRRNLVHDGAPPPDKEFMDPPPKPQSSVVPPYPSAANENGPAVVFSSDDARDTARAYALHDMHAPAELPSGSRLTRRPIAALPASH